MGLSHSSSAIVADGLVYALDAGNTKSYPGRGPVNNSSLWYDLIGWDLNNESQYGPRAINLSLQNWSYADGAITTNGAFALDYPFVSHNTGGWTWECWVRFNSWGPTNKGYLFRANSSGFGEGFYVEQSSFATSRGLPFLERNNGSGASGANINLMPNPIALGDWSHLVCTGTTSSGRFIYYNGTLVSSQSPSSLFQPTQMSTIGGSFTEVSFGQVRVYDRRLSSSEIDQNFNAHRARYRAEYGDGL